jgi:hypothetical protein
VLCYRCNLTNFDLEVMTVGMCLDFITEWLDAHNPKKERKRKATQADFDAF